MDYKKILCRDFVNKKLQYENDKVWQPNEPEKNGFKIGEIVWHVNKEKRILTQMQIVVEQIYTEYTLSAPCPLFGRFREYCNPIERVTLKPLNGTWHSGDEYCAMWFNGILEFPFELIKLDSKVFHKLKEVWTCKFTKADKLWDSLNAI